MFGWIVRIVMSLAGVITGWFLARNAVNFEFIQVLVTLLLITLFVSVAVFWPDIVDWFRKRWKSKAKLEKEPPPRP